jgi:hypothetical protein
MDILNGIMEALNGQMTRPEYFTSLSASWFHYLALLLMVMGMILTITRLKGASDAKVRKTVLGFALVLIAFEIYKQLNFSYSNNWNYRWYAFPFQFCSTPMYVALLAGVIRKGRLQDALYAFLGTFGFFAGFAVMFYPATVFVTTIGINIQTMVHHGGMAVLGIGLLANRVKPNSSSILSAMAVFTVLVLVALSLNAWHNAFIQDGTFNMFFINPIYDNDLPILSMVQPIVPFPVFLMVYVLGFTFVSYLMLLGRIGIGKLFGHAPEKALQTA